MKGKWVTKVSCRKEGGRLAAAMSKGEICQKVESTPILCYTEREIDKKHMEKEAEV